MTGCRECRVSISPTSASLATSTGGSELGVAVAFFFGAEVNDENHPFFAGFSTEAESPAGGGVRDLGEEPKIY